VNREALARGAGALAVSLAATCMTRAAVAAPPSDVDLRAARQLFADAEKDEDAGHWSDALDKLRHVAGVKLTAGVRYHMALCEEHLGHLANALDDFTAADSQARADGAGDVLRLVGTQLVDLGPRVPRLTVHVIPASAPAMVKLDGVAIAPALVGTAILLDPGAHSLEAAAPGYVAATTTVTLKERDVISLDLTLGVPPVGALPAPAASAPVPPPAVPPAPRQESPAPTSPDSTSMSASASTVGPRTGALLATGGALLLVAGGVGAYVLAGNALSSGTTQCAQEVTTSPCDGQKNTVRAWDFTAAAAWVAAAGVGVLAVYLWTRSPPASTSSATLLLGPTSVGVAARF
jgi:hypothetical protein